MARKKGEKGKDTELSVKDYRHKGAKRKNIPPALRFDQTGSPDKLPKLLETARRRPLTGEEAELLANALRSHDPWLEWSGKREKKSFEVNPISLHIHERISAQAILKIIAREEVQCSLFADPRRGTSGRKS
ncbi:MAG: hypothetical protein FJ117_12335 [Deltaproteobacteria bacterium]|nr:hypothetical protein [Deltaproteobacteria bacterium]